MPPHSCAEYKTFLLSDALFAVFRRRRADILEKNKKIVGILKAHGLRNRRCSGHVPAGSAGSPPDSRGSASGGMTVHPVRIADVGDVELALRQGGRILPAKDPVVALALLPNHENSSPVYRKVWKHTG